MLMKLQEYITAELTDYEFYMELSKMAPSDEAKFILIGIAEDEKCHAEMFQKIYRQMTGCCCCPKICPIVLQGKYEDILIDRVFDETADYKKYRCDLLTVSPNTAFWNACYKAGTDENCHANKLLCLVEMD